jgi:hypothetical protein
MVGDELATTGFTRHQWLQASTSGFAFLKSDSVDVQWRLVVGEDKVNHVQRSIMRDDDEGRARSLKPR